MNSPNTLRAINGGRKTNRPRGGRRLALDQCEQITCWYCENTNGVASSRFREVILCPRRRPTGSIVGGQQFFVCDYCDTQVL